MKRDMKQQLYMMMEAVLPIVIYMVGTAFIYTVFEAFNAAITARNVTAAQFFYLHRADVLIIATGFACSITIIAMLSHYWEELGLNEKRENKLETVFMAKCGAIAVIVSVVLTYLFNVLGLVNQIGYKNVYNSQLSGSIGVEILVYVFLTPLAEEIIFRGIAYDRVEKLMPGMSAIVMTSLLFGLYHLDVVQGLFTCILSLPITYYYAQKKRLVVPYMMHALANLVAIVISTMG